MEGSLPGPAVPPDQAAQALVEALAFRGRDAEIRPGPKVALPSGLTVDILGDCYRWPVGRGLQIHPTSHPEGAASLIAEHDTPLFQLRRRYPSWVILQPVADVLIAVPAAPRLLGQQPLRADGVDELARALRHAEGEANAGAPAPPAPDNSRPAVQRPGRPETWNPNP